MSNKQHTIDRTGKAPLTFSGEMLSEACEGDRSRDPIDYTLYRTAAGKMIIHRESYPYGYQFTQMADFSAEVFSSEKDMVERLLARETVPEAVKRLLDSAGITFAEVVS